MTALNTIIGFKLFYLVVKDEDISTKLCKSGILWGDLNIIPNNKIWVNVNNIEKVTKAK